LKNSFFRFTYGRVFAGLSDINILSISARTLQVLNLTLYFHGSLAGFCDGLKGMAEHNMLGVLSFEFRLEGGETVDTVGSTLQKVENVLAKPGWSALRQVTIKIPIECSPSMEEGCKELSEALQSLPDKYLSYLSKLESVDFNFSAYVEVDN